MIRENTKNNFCRNERKLLNLSTKSKSVQFADGIRPGEGTSPSGGEELSSPPPASTTNQSTDKKRLKKMKIPKKNKKKKIKVKC